MKQSKFLTKVRTEALPKLEGNPTQYYRTLEPIEYYSELTDTIYTIPVGFITDLASVPRIFQWLLPPDGEYKYESILHDYFFRTPEVDVTFDQANDIFLEAMKVGKVAEWKEYVIYRAVCWFGKSGFKERV